MITSKPDVVVVPFFCDSLIIKQAVLSGCTDVGILCVVLCDNNDKLIIAR